MIAFGQSLEYFRKLITDFIGYQDVVYSKKGSIIERNCKHPWVNLELIRSLTESTIEDFDSELVENELIPYVEIRSDLLIYVHVLYRDNSNFESLYTAYKLQALFAHPEFVSGLQLGGLIISYPNEESAIECDTVEFLNREESDDWFPIILGVSLRFNFKQLNTGWFNKVLMSTNVSKWNENLDDELMEGP